LAVRMCSKTAPPILGGLLLITSPHFLPGREAAPERKLLPRRQGDMGSLDTAASPGVFNRTQKQTSTLLVEAGHRARGSGCEAGPASRLDQGSEPALALPSERAESPYAQSSLGFLPRRILNRFTPAK
jgi:hypothetical protein